MFENSERPVIIIQPDMTPLSLKEFAEKKGLDIEVVKTRARRGIYPTMKMGNGQTIFINQAAMFQRSLEADGWDVRHLQPYLS
ncbi:hypothetical protein [Vibrio scophthalmi]|uniref:Uncharacterized protein n=1 Tax=Vibrio scophthalmi TaxID=45658 RepID=A0A1E3WN06_9VIBR|nr:hypothetical protein [Vibrio scophthalmi]ODS10362.1 hypothetical protein VSF3289_00617 [Vibrio scophthalmi]